MTVFGSIIAQNYLWCHYRNRQGLAKTQGPMMVGLVWVANVYTIYAYYLFTQLQALKDKDPAILNRDMWEWLHAFKLSFLVGSLLVFLLVYFLFRINWVYNSIINKLLRYSEQEQHAIVKQGHRYFWGSILVLVLAYGILTWFFVHWGFWDAFNLETN